MTKKSLTFIDMFAGIGGFRSGMTKVGMKPVGWIEWNKFARQCYEAMYHTKNEFTASDIQQVHGTDLPMADIWTFGSPCFVGTMQVKCAENRRINAKRTWRNIKDVAIGDYVISIDGQAHQVLDKMVHFAKHLLAIETPSVPLIKCTSNHPFYVRSFDIKRHVFAKPSYLPASQIKSGDLVLDDRLVTELDQDKHINLKNDGEYSSYYHGYFYNQRLWVPVTDIQKERLAKPVKVYNLEVEGTHTYNVNGIIVHNCQNISIAGRQEGLVKGKQSSMFFEVIRLLKERIKAKQSLPKYLWMENVKALLSSNKGWDFACVLIEMEQIGYDVEWSVIDSARFVPQHRERVYIIGHLRKAGTRQVFPLGRKDANSAQANEIKIVANDSKTGYKSHDVVDESGISKTIDATSYKHKPLVRIKQLGNYRKTAKSFSGNPQTGRVYDPKGISPTLNTMQGGDRQPKVLVRATITPDRIHKRQNGRRFKDDGEPSFTLTAEDRHGVMLEKETNPPEYKIRKLTPLECWRLQGFTDKQFNKAKNAGVSDSQLYARAGNAVTVPVIEAIARKIVQNENND